jgi:hypothetical protein
MARLKFLTWLLFFSFILSCSGDDEAGSSDEAKWSGTYIMVSADLKTPMPDRDGTIHSTKWNILEQCEKDNLIILQSDGVAIKDDGATFCFGSPNRFEGTWELNAAKTKIILDGSDIYTIVSSSSGKPSFMREYTDKWWVDPAGVTEDGIVQEVWEKQ